MSRLDRLLYVRKQKERERQTSFPPLERNPAWDEEDRQRWSRYPLKPEYDPSYTAPEAVTEQPEPPPASEPEPAPVVAAGSAPVPDPPKPEPVPFTETFDALNKLIWRYLVCSEYQRIVLALWIVHTYCFDILPFTPYLNIYSPEKQSGKTICLQLLRMLASNPWMPGGGLTASRLMERIAQRRPTLLLDDWQTAFRPAETQAIIGFLNASSTEDSLYSVRSTASEDKDIFCPKAFAGSGSLPAPLADRSIPIVLQRRKRSQQPIPFCTRVIRPSSGPLVEQIRRWIENKDNERVLLEHATDLFFADLPRFSMRQRECALPLLAIAHALGGKWPRRARLALHRVFDIYTGKDLSAGTQLLADIREFFITTGKQKVFTAELLEHLNNLDGRPWSRDRKGKPLNPNSLRDILQHFDVCPGYNQWIQKQQRKGFCFADFTEAWDSYLPPAPPAHNFVVTGAASEVVQTASEVVQTGSQVVQNGSQVVQNPQEVVQNSSQVVQKTAEIAALQSISPMFSANQSDESACSALLVPPAPA